MSDEQTLVERLRNYRIYRCSKEGRFYHEALSLTAEAADALASQAVQIAELQADAVMACSVYAAQITELQAEVEGDRQMRYAHSELMDQVWAILGRDDYREGGNNLVGRVRELSDRATTAETQITDLKRALDTARNDAREEHGTAARFARLHGIVSRILWMDVGVPAAENAQTKQALDDLTEYLFADGIDAALKAKDQAHDEG